MTQSLKGGGGRFPPPLHPTVVTFAMMYMDKPFKKNTAIFHKNKNVIFLIHGDFKLSRNKRFSALKVHNIIDSEGNSQPNLATLGSTLCVFPHVGVT